MKKNADGLISNKEQYLYQRFFCEENIYKFCQTVSCEGIDLTNVFVIFLTRTTRFAMEGDEFEDFFSLHIGHEVELIVSC